MKNTHAIILFLLELIIFGSSMRLDSNYVFDSIIPGTWESNYTSAQPELGIGYSKYFLCGYGFRQMKFQVSVCNCNCRNVVSQQVSQWKCSYCNNTFWTQSNAFKGIFCSYGDWNLKIERITQTGNTNSGSWRQFRCPPDQYATRVAVKNTGTQQNQGLGLNGMLMQCKSRDFIQSTIVKDNYDLPVSQFSINQPQHLISSYKLKYQKNGKLLGIDLGLEYLQVKSITVNEIMQYRWKFQNMNTFLDYMTFHSNKTTTGHQNFNEKYWQFDGTYLSVLNGNKQVTTKYVQSFKDYNGKWILRGYYLGMPAAWQAWQHLLIQDVRL